MSDIETIGYDQAHFSNKLKKLFEGMSLRDEENQEHLFGEQILLTLELVAFTYYRDSVITDKFFASAKNNYNLKLCQYKGVTANSILNRTGIRRHTPFRRKLPI